MFSFSRETSCLSFAHTKFPVLIFYLTSTDANILMQWAEVLSADAFSAFEDVGLNNDKVFDVLPFWCILRNS